VGEGPGGSRADPSFRRLWAAFVLAQAGSAVGAVAVPLIAIRELGWDQATIALLATVAAVVQVMAAVPAGHLAEFRRKRPVMVAADLIRAVSTLAVAGLFLLGALHVTALMGVLALNAAMQVLFASASAAHTKDLLRPEHRADGLGKLQTAAWASMITGPVVAGAIAAVSSPVVLLFVNAAAFLGSAALIRTIPTPENPPPARTGEASGLAGAAAGLRHLLTDPVLRRLFISWVLFAGAVAALTPVTAVFALQDLRLTEGEYGLLMGLPSLGGLAGSWLTGAVTRRWGLGPTLWWGSLLRIPWYLLYPLTPRGGGMAGLVVLMVAFTGVLFFSAMTNSAISALRMDHTPDRLMARASAAWTMATMAAGPVLIPGLGLVMQLAGARTALWAIAGIVATSALVLPAHRLRSGRQWR